MAHLRKHPGACSTGRYGKHTAVRVLCMSIYADPMKEWTKLFSPKQVLVIPFSGYTAGPRPTLTAIAEHMGLLSKRTKNEIGKIKKSEHKNSGSVFEHRPGKQKDTKMTPDLRDELEAFFAPHDKHLSELLSARGVRIVGGVSGAPY